MKQYHLNKLSPELGAEIGGIDLSKDFNEEIQNKIYDDLINYKVLFFQNWGQRLVELICQKILMKKFKIKLRLNSIRKISQF